MLKNLQGYLGAKVVFVQIKRYVMDYHLQKFEHAMEKCYDWDSNK